ncbi:N-acetylglucosamine kinase [Psychrobacillus sp. NPDC093180]|uniref:N-acetylglucosamine kinase n=1 Tax=Psychrobacillus sp. NPDC093180 TaxID=3364489 RepID=UPI00380CD811
MYLLGIDGGGTKTEGVVADAYGNVFVRVVTGPSNPTSMSKEEFERTISELLQQIQSKNPDIFNQIEVCFAGMAGVGEKGSQRYTKELLKKYLPSRTNIFVDNDAVNALYSGTLGEAGIVQIAGTGAITFGINKNKKVSRVGGWGYLFDDEGSGFYLGNEALKAVFKEHDGRGPSTTLKKQILSYFQLESVPEIIEKVYGREHPKSVIAPISRFVVEEAINQDVVALEIIDEACEKMFHSIKTCHQVLFQNEEPTIIVLSGGVFTDSKLFIQRFQKLAMSSTLPNLMFRKNIIPPVGGAIVAGLNNVQMKLGVEFAETFYKQFKEFDIL